MKFDEIIKKRKSVHAFKNKKVKWKDILIAVDSANQGPFASNLNNLKFIIIEEKEKIKQIAEDSDQLWITEASSLIVVCSNEKDLENIYDERGRVYSRQQAGAAINTLLLKLTDLGISSCWVGSYDDHLVRLHLEIPKNINIEAIIPVGYESGNTSKKRKRPLEGKVYWETWDSSKRPTLIKDPKDRYSLA